ncbi:MAG: efflux RND transporter permease subunit [Dehalococcoidia bacterium]|nr:efflux RND transporter permease subunit [Dehalococcoidia bacterium]
MTYGDAPGNLTPDNRKGGTEEPIKKPAIPRIWLADLSIAQPVFITMCVLAIIVVGLISYTRMGLNLFPNISFPIAVIQTTYPGANPEEIERSVTKPIEDALISINGVDTVSSTSMDSVSMVIVQFDMDKNDKEGVDDIRTRINTMRNSLPADVQDPVILRFDPSGTPIMSFAVADTTGKRSVAELRSILEDQLKPRLEQVQGVAAVNVVGGIVREVHVDLKLAQLEAQGISSSQVTQAIRTESLDVPAGRISDGQREELLRTSGQVKSLAQLGDIPVVTRPSGVVVKIKDVATVAEGQAEVRTLSRLDGRDSVVGQVQKQSGTNTVAVADGIKLELDRLQKENPELSFAIAYDESVFTRQSVQDLMSSLLIGAILAALVVLLFFRDLRNTLVTVAGLPMVLLGTFAVLHLLGITLNMISLMALSLSVGMLIDDAIVVRENIFRHMEGGEEPKIAAGRGAGEIALAVIAVTSTIVAVFLPVAFTGGITGQFMRDFGVTVAVAVLISLVEALTLAPMLSAFFFKRVDSSRQSQKGLIGSLFEGLNRRYHAVLRWSLGHRLIVVVVAIAIFGASLALLPFMVFSFVPDTDQGQFAINVVLPPGARLGDTDQKVRAVEQIVKGAPEVAHVFTTVGSSDGSVEGATVNVKLRELGQTNGLIERLRPQIQQAITGAKLSINRQSGSAIAGGSAMSALTGAPIQFAVQGDDFNALDQISAELVNRFKEIPGAIDVDRSIKAGKPGQVIILDRSRAADLGVGSAQLGATVRSLVNGDRAGTYRAGNKDLNIIVRLAEADRTNIASIQRLPIMTARGNQVPLSTVATIVESSEPSQISRDNRQRQVLVVANYLGRSVGEVLADARLAVASLDLPSGVTIKVVGQTKMQDEMMSSFSLALGLALLFVYMILASQFRSFVHPFTIMLALPFSIVGALLSLFIFRFNFDMLAMIGIILLMGLVTKNSILLVEFINQLRRRGLSVLEAILEAGPIRLRPILMTTLAMIFGMLPSAIGIGAGSEMRKPMSVAVIGGLLTSTLLTLVVVPVAYSLIADLSARILRSRQAPAAIAVQEVLSIGQGAQEAGR